MLLRFWDPCGVTLDTDFRLTGRSTVNRRETHNKMLSLNTLNYVIVSSIVILVFTRASTIDNGKRSRARLVEEMKIDAQNHGDIANRIIEFVTSGPAKHQVYDRLATFTDTFGNRISGSKNLENSIDYMLEKLHKDGLENVHGEEVKVPHWVRGNESATMLSPRKYAMNILGLGSSIGTPPEGITADVLVVKSFDELKTRAKEVFENTVSSRIEGFHSCRLGRAGE